MQKIRLLSPKEVEARTSLSEREIKRRWMQDKFPRPVKLGTGPHGRLGFVEHEVDEWLHRQVADNRDRTTATAA